MLHSQEWSYINSEVSLSPPCDYNVQLQCTLRIHQWTEYKKTQTYIEFTFPDSQINNKQ